VSAQAAPRPLGAPPREDLRRMVELTWTLAVTEFKLRFYGSVLGYAWTLVRPFALFGVIYVVFSEIVHVGKGIPFYAAYVLVAMVLFQYCIGIVSMALPSLVGRENLLRKMRFPRIVIPLSVTLQATFDLVMTLTAVVIFVLVIGVTPTWGWLEMIPLIGVLTAFSTGLGLLLSVLYVRFRDMQPIWDVVAQMLFYASPVLYVASQIPQSYARLLSLSPIASVLNQMRHAMIDPSAPSAADLIGGADRLLVPLAVMLVAVAAGAWLFRREAPRVAENL
jgi:ABC-2 type transport system permease protein